MPSADEHQDKSLGSDGEGQRKAIRNHAREVLRKLTRRGKSAPESASQAVKPRGPGNEA